MERESLLSVLIFLFSGLALQLFALLPTSRQGLTHAQEQEKRLWLHLWWPLLPPLFVAAWLCGWALSEPDPVPDRVGPLVLLGSVPFVVIVFRALVRALWSLLRPMETPGIATIGLLRPRIQVSCEFTDLLDETALHAALEHERAHRRHFDPLRIWLAQVATDLQWPWPSAHRRFQDWLAGLECARDEEACGAGVDGSDLAAAILAAVRFRSHVGSRSCAHLTGDAAALKERIARLLHPLVPQPATARSGLGRTTLFVAAGILLALAFGIIFGEQVLGPFLALTS